MGDSKDTQRIGQVRNILTLGDGAWGTALSILLHNEGYKVTLWGHDTDYIQFLNEKRENVKFLPGISIPPELTITDDFSEPIKYADILVIIIPTPYLRSVLERVVSYYREGLPIVTGSKGIENVTLMRGSEIIEDVLKARNVVILSGPSHAEEVARKLPTTIVASSKNENMAEEIQKTFMTDYFRIYTNPDTIGVELGGALKNVIAIAGGICDGLNFGDNSKAALLTRGLAEICRLGVAMGAQASTFMGLAGMGDLITTCVSPFGRNRAVGEAIGMGKKLKEILAEMEQVAEGIWTTKSACQLADKYNVEMPITHEVYNILFEDKDPLIAVSDLMMREPRPEIDNR